MRIICLLHWIRSLNGATKHWTTCLTKTKGESKGFRSYLAKLLLESGQVKSCRFISHFNTVDARLGHFIPCTLGHPTIWEVHPPRFHYINHYLCSSPYAKDSTSNLFFNINANYNKMYFYSLGGGGIHNVLGV